MVQSIMMEAGSTGADEPPGITALSVRPLRTPPAISSSFEKRYHIATKIDRNLWLVRTRFQPEYAGRPWMLWTANPMLDSEASDEPLRWVVVGK